MDVELQILKHLARDAHPTVALVDEYCAEYKDLFKEVRNYECFKYLHLGIISPIKRKSLPEIAKVVSINSAQSLHHFIGNSEWSVNDLKLRRLNRIKRVLNGRAITLVIDETGDRKKGKKTDYVARQYLGSVGKVDNGIVSVNAYGVYSNIIFPLIVKIFKPNFQDLLSLIHLYQEEYPKLTPRIQEALSSLDLDFLVEDLQKLLGSIKMGAERIRNIVVSLRNFSRLDQVELKPINIHNGLDDTLVILQHRLRQQGKRPEIVVIKQYAQLPLVTCYASQLNQVFMNILSNAIDALEETHNEKETSDVPLRITISTQAIDSDWVSIRIADKGCGMSQEVLSRIFDPFFTTKPVGSGTGLGLSISYSIVVDKHQGQLQCYSSAGQGTEFIISIPIRQRKANSLAVV